MDQLEIIKIILVTEISNEIENEYLEKKITYEQYKEVFESQADLMDTVPRAVGEVFFDQKVDELFNANFLFLSNEVLNDDENDFNEKDIGMYLIDSDNDVPEKYHSSKHINTTSESLLWNASNACVDKILKKE